MKKSISSFLGIFICILIFSIGISFSECTDLSGTWNGEAEVPSLAEPLNLTLVLLKEAGGYKGVISDDRGLIPDSECRKINFEDAILIFYFGISTDEGPADIYVNMKVSGDKMSGYWKASDGASARIKLAKCK